MNEKLYSVRSLICSAAGAAGSLLASLFGGWSSDLSTLVIFMAVDFATGIAVAALCRSGKTKTGGLSSAAGWRGLTKKIMTLLMVVVAHRMDLILQIDYIKTAAVIAFTLNEAISILENAGLIGIPMPKVLIQAVDLLKGKTKEDTTAK
jgi:toxin secretion/phage lysis holin